VAKFTLSAEDAMKENVIQLTIRLAKDTPWGTGTGICLLSEYVGLKYPY
jgi:hypothetical protein